MSEKPVSNESVNDIRKFQNHPIIIKIKENHQRHFSFSAVEVKMIKANRDIFSGFIMHNFNEGISTVRFRIDKENYRPISILLVISKIFERLIFNQ